MPLASRIYSFPALPRETFHGLPGLLAAEEEYWEYTFRPGDSIWKIAEKYTTSVNNWVEIQELNKIRQGPDRRIPPGTRIIIPVSMLKQQPVPAVVIAVFDGLSREVIEPLTFLSSGRDFLAYLVLLVVLLLTYALVLRRSVAAFLRNTLDPVVQHFIHRATQALEQAETARSLRCHRNLSPHLPSIRTMSHLWAFIFCAPGHK